MALKDVKHLKSLILPLLVYIIPLTLAAQNEANVWYFGNHAGINFGNSPPRAISNPNLSTLEGCSSIADSSGALLFYTDGRTIWNKKDSIMPNGSDLKGDASSTHSSVIVKKPLSPGEYYVITADAGSGIGGPNMTNYGVNYTLVNMDLNAGFGAVTTKNIPLVEYSAEKIAATPHKNGIYTWVAIPKGRSKAIYMYLATENGLEFKHADSSLLSSQIGTYGQIKFSPDGKRLAFLSQNNVISIFNFNNVTGKLQNSQTITGGDELYGLEFSPSGKYLYISTWFSRHKLCQCEVQSGTTNYLTDCKFYPDHNVSGQLQLGPDQKIYVLNNNFRYLGVISNPDSAFNQSNYIDSAITLLQGTSCRLGLPTFHTGYLNVAHIAVNDICEHDTAYYQINTGKFTYDSLRWLINGQPTTDTTGSGKQRFDNPGMYEVSIVFYTSNYTDTFSRSFTVRSLPIAPLLEDTSVCVGDSFFCNAYRQPNIFYLWSTGDTASSLSTFQPGKYNLKLTLNRCSILDSFTLIHNPYPMVNIPDETIICEGSTTTMSAEQTDAQYLWSTGETSPFVTLSNAQTYWVSVTQNRCTTIDTFEVRSTTLPQVSLGDDTTICEEQQFSLNVLSPYSTYLWSTASTQPEINILTSGMYSVLVTNPCGTVADTVQLTTEICNCSVWTPNAFSPNGDQTNDLFYPQLSCAYAEYDFRIYTKWGQEIFRSNSPAVAWNGNVKGEAAPNDVYVWKLNCLMSNKGGKQFTETQNGTVTLLR